MPDSAIPDVNPSIVNEQPEDQWTLMFLIMGDNSLSPSMISQLKELNDAGYQKNTNVLLYFDPNCNGKRARIYDVNNRRKARSRNKTFIGDGENSFVRTTAEGRNIQFLQQMPAAESLRYFLTYSRIYYPAKNYLLFLMGHGVIVGNDEFLPDTDDNSSVTLADLGTILKTFRDEVKKKNEEFHLVGFHSCGMSSVELAFELQDTARYMLATQGSAFPGSWPYRQLLKKIFKAMENPSNSSAPDVPYPNKLIKDILEGLQDLGFYNGHDFVDAGFSTDLSMCSLDSEKLKELKAKLKDLVRALRKGLTNSAKDAILLAHLKSQSYFAESYTDLYDLCECLQEYCAPPPSSPPLPLSGSHKEIWDACAGVKGVLQRTNGAPDPKGDYDKPVVFSDYYGPAFQHSNGLSIFFPWNAPLPPVMNSYDNYRFTKELESDSWISFLRDYFQETKRPRKIPPSETHPTTAAQEGGNTVQSNAPLRAPLETKSDEEVLRLGPPPRHRSAAVIFRMKLLRRDLKTKIATQVNEIAALAKTNTETETVANVESRLTGMESVAKEIDRLTKDIEKLANELDLLPTENGPLARERRNKEKEQEEKMNTLGENMEALEKETASLAIIGKEAPSLAKETASLAKETASLAKETASLAASTTKETASLAKETASLAGSPEKETASLAKEIASLGRFGFTLIKNFDLGEDQEITSRPIGNRGKSAE